MTYPTDQILTGEPKADTAEYIYQSVFGDVDGADEHFHIVKGEEIGEWLDEEDWLGDWTDEVALDELADLFRDYDLSRQ